MQSDIARLGAAAGSETALEPAVRWAEAESSEVWSRFEDDMRWYENADGRESDECSLVYSWKKATKPYDSAERREGADQTHSAAGVPADERLIRATSDLLNGVDPADAAGTALKAQKPARRASAVSPGRQAARRRWNTVL